MSRISLFSRIFALGSCFFVAACSSLQSGSSAQVLPLNSTREQQATEFTTLPAATSPRWGIGLVAEPQLQGFGSFQHVYCQDADFVSACPEFHYGKRTSTYDVSKSLIANYPFARVSLVDSGTSSLGNQKYSQTQAAGGLGIGYTQFSSGSADMRWTDVLEIKSATLKKGTPVSLSVSLAVKPSISGTVGCDATGGSSASLQANGPGADSINGGMQVNGTCRNGSFVYYIGGGSSGPSGKTDSGVLSGFVGQSLNILGELAVNTEAYCDSYCKGGFSSALAGSAKWTITAITPGATYTSASGTNYH